MGKALIVGNWKMNLTLSDSLVLTKSIYKNTSLYKNIEVALAPASIFIFPIAQNLRGKRENFSLACQNVMYENSGEFTGEISPLMVKNLCSYVIIGHSERRKYFNENASVINAKLKATLKNNLKAIVCVGEQERYHLEDHFDYEVKRMQKKGGILADLEEIFSSIDKNDFKNITIAYEPVWAIGTSNASSGAYSASISYIIKSHLKERFSDSAETIKILYGGSVNKANAAEFLIQPNIDGLLVGGASLKASEFSTICKVASQLKKDIT